MADTLLFLILFIVAVALLVGIAIAAAAYKRDAARFNDIIAAQDQIGRASLDIDITLQLIVDKLLKLTRASGAAIELSDGGALCYRATSGALKALAGTRLELAESVLQYCIRNGEVTVCRNSETDERFDRAMSYATPMRSWVAAPLLNNGAIIGALKISSPRANAFDRKDEQVAQMLAGFVSTALARQQDSDLKQKLLAERSYMALHDMLTTLPNRALFMEMLGAAIHRLGRNKSTMGLMFLDLDGFKGVNDSLGHQAGDVVLQQFAARLKACVRETDCVARLGGDEFTIILENLAGADENLSLIARKIISAMVQPFVLEGKLVVMTASIGIAFTSDSKQDIEALIKTADTELYNAKRKGKNQFSIENAAPAAQPL